MSLTKEHEQFIKEYIENGNLFIISGMFACKKDFECNEHKLKTYEPRTTLLHEYLIKYYPEELL